MLIYEKCNFEELLPFVRVGQNNAPWTFIMNISATRIWTVFHITWSLKIGTIVYINENLLHIIVCKQILHTLFALMISKTLSFQDNLLLLSRNHLSISRNGDLIFKRVNQGEVLGVKKNFCYFSSLITFYYIH